MQELLKCSTEVTEHLKYAVMGVYISKLPYGGCGGEKDNVIFCTIVYFLERLQGLHSLKKSLH